MVVNNHPIGYAEDSEIYVTKDKGASWKRKNVPFEMNGANLKFHATNADAILATDASRSRFKIFEKSPFSVEMVLLVTLAMIFLMTKMFVYVFIQRKID